MSTVGPSQGVRGDKGRRGVEGDKGDRGDPGSTGHGVEAEIHALTGVVADQNMLLQSLADRLRLTKWALIVLALIVGVLIVLGWQVRAVQDDLGVAQEDLRASSCDAAALWLSLLELPQVPPDPPLTDEQQAQADATSAEFKAKYTTVFESLNCADLAR